MDFSACLVPQYANSLLAASLQRAWGPVIQSSTIIHTTSRFGLPALAHSHLCLLQRQSPGGLFGRQRLVTIFCKCENGLF